MYHNTSRPQLPAQRVKKSTKPLRGDDSVTSSPVAATALVPTGMHGAPKHGKGGHTIIIPRMPAPRLEGFPSEVPLHALDDRAA